MAWAYLSTFIALFVGGMVTSLLTVGESKTEAVVHGVLMWALLLAGLYADGPLTIREPAASRDHSERMLRRFGARVERHSPLD